MPVNSYDIIADLYDTYVPATFDVDFFVKEAKKCPGEVLELMSGTGRVSIPLLEAGVKLTCVDLSAELNAVFARKLHQLGLKAEIVQMDVRELALGRQFDMVIIPFHSFAHLAAPADQRKALQRIQRHLRPGGVFICTLGNPAVRGQTIDGQLRLFSTYELPDRKGSLLLWILERPNAEDPHVVEAMQFFEEYDAQGLLTAKRLMELTFRLTARDEFEQLAVQAGFKIKAFYGDYAYAEFKPDSSRFMVWILEKTGD